MRECDNSKIHISRKFVLSICLYALCATLLLTVYLITTATGYHLLYISQSHAPDDGQNIARNMLN